MSKFSARKLYMDDYEGNQVNGKGKKISSVVIKAVK